jgi:hypothetical protein
MPRKETGDGFLALPKHWNKDIGFGTWSFKNFCRAGLLKLAAIKVN